MPGLYYGKISLQLYICDKLTKEEAAALELDEVKKMIEQQVPGAFSKKAAAKKAPAKKSSARKAATKKKA